MYNCIVDEEIALLFAHDPLRVNDVFVTLLYATFIQRNVCAYVSPIMSLDL